MDAYSVPAFLGGIRRPNKYLRRLVLIEALIVFQLSPGESERIFVTFSKRK